MTAKQPVEFTKQTEYGSERVGNQVVVSNDDGPVSPTNPGYEQMIARWGDGDGEIDEVRIDASTNSWQTVDYSHHEIHGGNFFYVKNFLDVTVANTDFLFVTPNTTKWAHAQWEFAAEGEFELSLYRAVTTSNDGTPVPIYNANANSANTPGVTAFSGPTLAGGALGDGGQGGTLVWAAKIGSGRSATIGRDRGYEYVALQNTKYWFRVVKVAAGTLWLDYDFNWYEHTDKN